MESVVVYFKVLSLICLEGLMITAE